MVFEKIERGMEWKVIEDSELDIDNRINLVEIFLFKDICLYESFGFN